MVGEILLRILAQFLSGIGRSGGGAGTSSGLAALAFFAPDYTVRLNPHSPVEHGISWQVPFWVGESDWGWTPQYTYFITSNRSQFDLMARHRLWSSKRSRHSPTSRKLALHVIAEAGVHASRFHSGRPRGELGPMLGGSLYYGRLSSHPEERQETVGLSLKFSYGWNALVPESTGFGVLTLGFEAPF